MVKSEKVILNANIASEKVHTIPLGSWQISYNGVEPQSSPRPGQREVNACNEGEARRRQEACVLIQHPDWNCIQHGM